MRLQFPGARICGHDYCDFGAVFCVLRGDFCTPTDNGPQGTQIGSELATRLMGLVDGNLSSFGVAVFDVMFLFFTAFFFLFTTY